jgi:hypothetical protein
MSWGRRSPYLDLLADLQDHEVLADFNGALVGATGWREQLLRVRDWGTNVRVHSQARFSSSEYGSGLLGCGMVAGNCSRLLWRHAHALEDLWYEDFVNKKIGTGAVSDEILRDPGVAGQND